MKLTILVKEKKVVIISKIVTAYTSTITYKWQLEILSNRN
ncbi:hypothetical protein YN1551_0126 [Sulfolobus islandicus Y.N.15.51]|uniref:Uncharacterized protein n=3 Tax=Saccharolobus islandicus TaxID=43080 RepID=C3NJR9_SACI1|nr:hypothetical protein YN1551_0126 [Sulfolobus islandicus Y.N.15.51]ADB88505.1 hypothetical protein LD85_2907 [Sulfolobus islandicus L.D.8.5]ADX83871.1 hypothetical protein SiH_2534 [Sulfolobus islandicus HVE10/4]